MWEGAMPGGDKWALAAMIKAAETATADGIIRDEEH